MGILFQDFLGIYDDPFWEDSIDGGLAAGRVPAEFNVERLYQGTLVELEHTFDPYLAIEIAMDHLTEDSNYYTKLKTIEATMRAYRRNPKSYEEMSLGELKREEKRLLETIDDSRFFKTDLERIPALEAQLVAVRRALSPGECISVPSTESPENAIQEQLSTLHDEIKTLKALERTAWDVGDMEKAGKYQRKSSGLKEVIEDIKPLLQKIVGGRLEVATAEGRLRTIAQELTSTEDELRRIFGSLQAAQGAGEIQNQRTLLTTEERLQQKMSTLRFEAYQQVRLVEEASKRVNIALDIAYRDLEGVGYQVERPQKSAPSPVVTQIVERPISPPQAPQLSSELSDVYTQLSADPAIASLQNQLRLAVQELTIAIEDREPQHIVRRMKSKVAELHAEITRRTAKRYRYY